MKNAGYQLALCLSLHLVSGAVDIVATLAQRKSVGSKPVAVV
jgi:hypothetical protein